MWDYETLACYLDIAFSYYFDRVDCKEPIVIDHTRWAAVQNWQDEIMLEAGWSEEQYEEALDCAIEGATTI